MLSDIWVYTRTAKLMIGLLLLAALLLATQNWPLGLLFFIIVAGVIVYVKRSDYGQEKKLLRYLDDLSSGVSAGTVYAVKNLPVGIAMMDEKKELVWANNVFRGWLGEGAEVGVRFQDLITGQKISKIWGKTGWFECHPCFLQISGHRREERYALHGILLHGPHGCRKSDKGVR